MIDSAERRFWERAGGGIELRAGHWQWSWGGLWTQMWFKNRCPHCMVCQWRRRCSWLIHRWKRCWGVILNRCGHVIMKVMHWMTVGQSIDTWHIYVGIINGSAMVQGESTRMTSINNGVLMNKGVEGVDVLQPLWGWTGNRQRPIPDGRHIFQTQIQIRAQFGVWHRTWRCLAIRRKVVGCALSPVEKSAISAYKRLGRGRGMRRGWTGCDDTARLSSVGIGPICGSFCNRRQPGGLLFFSCSSVYDNWVCVW